MKSKKKHPQSPKPAPAKKAAVPKKRPFLWHYLVIALFAFILYGNTIPNKYSMDDNFVTETNKSIVKGFGGLGEIFTTHYTEGNKYSYDYRPIVKATYAVEYQFFGANPHVSHFLNVLLYALTGLFLFYLLKRLLKDFNPVFPFIIVLLYMAHPIHSEVVGSLKNRDEILTFLGSLATLYFCLNYVENNKILNIFAAVFSFFFALLSKGNAFTFVAVIPLTLFFFTSADWKKILFLLVFLFAMYVVYRYLPKSFLPAPSRQKFYFENPFLFEKDFWARIATSLFVLGIYLKLLFYPHPLLFYYGYKHIPVMHLDNGWVILTFLLYLALFCYAVYRIREKHLVSYGILFYLITLSMFANVVRPVMGLLGERYLYAASLGFCIVAGYYLLTVCRVRPADKILPVSAISKVIVGLVIILIPFSAKTIVRNQDWKDRFTLYEHDIPYLENSIKANNMLGSAIMDKVAVEKNGIEKRRLVNEALKYYLQANKLAPDYAITLNNIGSIYYSYFSEYDKGADYFRQAVKIDTAYSESYFNLGNYYEKMNQPAEAEKYYIKAIRSDNRYQPAYSGLSNFYAKWGGAKSPQPEPGPMKARPGSEVPYINLGNFYMSKKDTAKAVSYLEKVVELSPKYRKICLHLATYFRKVGNTEKADYYQNKAIESKKFEDKQPK